MADRPALRRLVAIDPDLFAERYWALRPLLCRANELSRDFSDLFTLGAVDELVAHRGLRTPFVRMATEGSVLAASRYTSRGGFGAEIADQLDSDKVLHELANGSTLVLQALHRTWQPIADFTRRLVAELAHPAQVNAYVTPAASRGFDPHYDVHDVFVVQIHGEKHWKIHRPVQESPLSSEPWHDYREAVLRAAGEAPAIDAVLGPGDVLYLPRGWIHSATALGGTSIHLTIGVSPRTRWDLVQQLVADAADNRELRRALPLGFDGADVAALAPIIADTITTIVAQLASTAENPARLGAALARALADVSPPAPLSPLATIEGLDSIDLTTVLSWRAGLAATLEFGDNGGRDDSGRDDGGRDDGGRDDGGRDDSVRIVLPTKTVSLPAEAASAVRALASGRPQSVGSLGGLDAASAVVVARRLVREGILVLA